MTEEESQLLSLFKNRLYRVISSCNDLKLQIVALQALNKKLEVENYRLKEQYNNLKFARITSMQQDGFKETKNVLSLLIKEIDKCLSLLY